MAPQDAEFLKSKIMQCQIRAPKIETLLDSSNQLYQEFLGYKPEQTRLQSLTLKQWQPFCEKWGLNPDSSGIYLPRNQTAVIQKESPLNLFHEYFGHGLYCEQSLQGKRLIDLEKRLLEKEKQKFKGILFNFRELREFRRQNQTFQELDEFRKQNLRQYELFAIWTEYLLTKELNLKELFERKYDSFSKQERESITSAVNFSERYGNLATFYASGLARKIVPGRVRKLLEGIYGAKALNDSRLVLLTGSRKPFSDIDLFASSNFLQSIKNNWLDLVVFNEEDFERRIKLFEVQVTLPIISGEFVAGDNSYLEQKRTQLKEQPITEEAIQHNQKKSDENRLYANKTNNEEDKRIALSYSQTYLANAKALRKGKRLFTKEDLFLYSQRASAEDDKPLQLQGGKEKNAT